MNTKKHKLEDKIAKRINDSRESCHHIINRYSKVLFRNLNDEDNFKKWTR